jgi:transcriptional regulator with XRE-family HTH domain
MDNCFGDNLETLIYKRGIKKITLAEKTGKKPTDIAHYIRGDNLPNSTTLQNMARLLGVTMDYLFTGERILPWIPVEEQLPAINERVLISLHSKDTPSLKGVDMAVYTGLPDTPFAPCTRNFYTNDFVVDAWMELVPYECGILDKN